MKKLGLFLFIAGVVGLTSCVKPNEKAIGTYTGTYTVSGASSGNSGTCTVTASGDDKVNFAITSGGFSASVTNIGVAINGNVSTFTSYTSSSTTNGDITALAGSVTDNSINLAFTSIQFGFPVAGTFNGTK